MFQKIKKWFIKPEGHEHKRFFNLSDDHPYKDRYEVFYKIISDTLNRRDEYPDWAHQRVTDNMHDYPYDAYYLQYMCEKIKEEFKVDIDLQDIINMDIYCSGHIDYIHKFAFRLAEVEHALVLKL